MPEATSAKPWWLKTEFVTGLSAAIVIGFAGLLFSEVRSCNEANRTAEKPAPGAGLVVTVSPTIVNHNNNENVNRNDTKLELKPDPNPIAPSLAGTSRKIALRVYHGDSALQGARVTGPQLASSGPTDATGNFCADYRGSGDEAEVRVELAGFETIRAHVPTVDGCDMQLDVQPTLRLVRTRQQRRKRRLQARANVRRRGRVMLGLLSLGVLSACASARAPIAQAPVESAPQSFRYTGHVRDATRNPLEGVEISAIDSGCFRHATSDSSGLFRIDLCPDERGNARVRLVRAGFKSMERETNVAAAGRPDSFTMEPRAEPVATEAPKTFVEPQPPAEQEPPKKSLVRPSGTKSIPVTVLEDVRGDRRPVAGAHISMNGRGLGQTNADGFACAARIVDAERVGIVIKAPGFVTKPALVTTMADCNDSRRATIVLERAVAGTRVQ